MTRGLNNLGLEFIKFKSIVVHILNFFLCIASVGHMDMDNPVPLMEQELRRVVRRPSVTKPYGR